MSLIHLKPYKLKLTMGYLNDDNNNKSSKRLITFIAFGVFIGVIIAAVIFNFTHHEQMNIQAEMLYTLVTIILGGFSGGVAEKFVKKTQK